MPCLRVFLSICLYAVHESAIVSSPSVSTRCSGESVTLDWKYTDTGNITSLIWAKSTTTILSYSPLTGSWPKPGYSGRVFNVDGALTLTGLQASDTGSYTFVVVYNNTDAEASTIPLSVYDQLNRTVSTVALIYGDRRAILTCILPLEAKDVTFVWTDNGNVTLSTRRSYITTRCGTYRCIMTGGSSSCLKAGLAKFDTQQVTGMKCPSNLCYGISFGIGFGIFGMFIGIPLSVVSKQKTAWEKRKLALIMTVVGYGVISLILLLSVSLTGCFKLKSCDCRTLEVQTGIGIGVGTTLVTGLIEVIIIVIVIRLTK